MPGCSREGAALLGDSSSRGAVLIILLHLSRSRQILGEKLRGGNPGLSSGPVPQPCPPVQSSLPPWISALPSLSPTWPNASLPGAACTLSLCPFLPSPVSLWPQAVLPGGSPVSLRSSLHLESHHVPRQQHGQGEGTCPAPGPGGGDTFSCLAWREGPKGSWQGLGGRCPQLCGDPPQHAPTGCAVRGGGGHTPHLPL